jgi:hypothetical protein
MTVRETGNNTGIFTSTDQGTDLGFSTTARDDVNELILVANGDTVTVTYVDVAPSGNRTDTAIFGTLAGPTVSIVTADDADNLDAVYSNGDTITVVFSENTNVPFGPNPTQGNLDTLFGAMGLGTTYSGTWSSADTLVITITNAKSGTAPTIGVTTYTLQAGGNLRNAAGTSLTSTDTSAAIAGDWGILTVPVNPGDAIIRNNLINPDHGEFTIITFNLNTSTKVNITVYDLAGKPVKVLYNRTASAGLNNVRWYGKNKRGRKVGPGIYYVVIMLGEKRHVEKVLVVK